MKTSADTDLPALSPELRDAVRGIARLVRGAGGRALLVGGAVRDLLSGAKSVKDVDIEVFGVAPDALRGIISAKYESDPCGESFGVLKIKHLPVDVSMPRRETKRGSGHKGFLVESDPSLSVKEAAARRDFTINAIYLDPLEGTVENPWNGVEDLEAGVLRHVTDRFREDPLRVLRGMQFIARFGLRPAPETVAVCRTMDIEGLAPERLFEEWSKLVLKGVKIGDGLRFLRDTGWVRHFPELQALIGCEQNREWHPEGDVWNHTCLCMDSFARERTGDRDEDLIVGLAVLCHDFGKPAVSSADPADGRIRSPGHDVAGLEPTLSFLRRLTNEEAVLRAVPPLVCCHMQPYSIWKSRASDSAVRRLAARVGRIDRLLRVCRADDSGRYAAGDAPGRQCAELEWLAAAADRLRIADSAPKPILMGRHLVGAGFKPSPEFKKILDAAYEAQLDGKFDSLPGALRWFAENIAPGAPQGPGRGRETKK